MLSRQGAIFVEIPTILQETVSKGSEMKSTNLVRMVILTKNVRNECLENSLDADLKIT